MRRVAAIASHPIQYQAPWYRTLAGVVDLHVFFCHQQDAAGQARAGHGVEFDWDVPLLDGYHFEWLQNRAAVPDVSSFRGCDTPEIAERLARGRFEACIVNGWYLKSYVQAVRACRRLGIRVLVRGDSHLRTPRSLVKSAAKYVPYRYFLNRIDAHLYVGRANRAYLESYGVPEERLFFVPHFVDNSFFAERAAGAAVDGTALHVRRELGVPEHAVVFLFVGRLVEKKHPGDFIRACAAAASRSSTPICGVIVGDGPLRAEAETLVHHLDAPVRFAGFRNQTQLPRCYAAADVLVLPSDGRETWGLVVNEGMACGLPALVARQAGCADDLIEEGVTGFTFEAGDVDTLAQRMLDSVGSARAAMSRNARARVLEYSVEKAVAGTLAALSV